MRQPAQEFFTPYSMTIACVITAPRRVIRSPSQRGTRPECSGRSALPERRAVIHAPPAALGRTR
jgi:hypothetical protein